jgi:GAF domain-containing protein/CheY-like chemotaxis protein/anti-sigma regulatory factor (Ser/Thr protein kinase)
MPKSEILIVDDDSRFRKSIVRGLKGDDYTFHEAQSVQEAIRKLDENVNIKVITLDLSLPDGNGTELLAQIGERASKYRVIILTAHEEHLGAEKARELSVFNYLPKTTRSFTQALRFTVAQAFADIERELLKDKNRALIEIQQRINLDIQGSAVDKYSSETLNGILNLICQSVRALIGAYTCHIRLYDLKKGDFKLVAFDGPSDGVETIFKGAKRKDELFSGKAATTKAPLLFDDSHNKRDFEAFRNEALERLALIDNDTRRIEVEEYFDTVQSVFIVPITTRMFGNEVDAVLSLSSSSVDFFSEDIQEVVKEFVTQAALAITKAWQRQRKEESHQDYKRISSVLQDITKELRGADINTKIFDIAIRGIADIIEPETVTIFLRGRTTGLLDTEAELRGNDRIKPSGEGHRTDRGLIGWVYRTSSPLRIPNLQQQDRREPQDHAEYRKDLEMQSGGIPSGRIDHYLGVPMVIGDEVVGAIQLLNKKSEYYLNPEIEKERWLLERGFSDDEETVLGIAASHVAVAIKNAELLEERSKKISQLETLKDVGRYTNAEMPLDELLSRIIEEAAKDLKAEICLLYLLDESKSAVVLEQCYGIPKEALKGARYEIGEGLSGTVARTGKSSLIANADLTGKYDEQILKHLTQTGRQGRPIESLMVVPIRAKGEILGVIKAINKKGPGKQYNEEDLSFFEAFANYVGIAIENAQRYDLASKQLANAESNSTLSNLVASVAHEINNTYGLIPASVQLLRKALGDVSNPNASEMLDQIETLARQMVYYGNEIGGYSTGRMGEGNPLDINEVVRTALSQIPEFRKPDNFGSISLVLRLTESPIMCWVHRNALIRTLRNIVINAYQSLDGKDSGEIVIATREDEAKNAAVIEVRDNGCGIKEQHKSRIFTPEFTTKPGSGSGIGLWLAQRYMDSIGGDIAFESKENRGTTFRLSIPLIRKSGTAKY